MTPLDVGLGLWAFVATMAAFRPTGTMTAVTDTSGHIRPPGSPPAKEWNGVCDMRAYCAGFCTLEQMNAYELEKHLERIRDQERHKCLEEAARAEVRKQMQGMGERIPG